MRTWLLVCGVLLGGCGEPEFSGVDPGGSTGGDEGGGDEGGGDEGGGDEGGGDEGGGDEGGGDEGGDEGGGDEGGDEGGEPVYGEIIGDCGEIDTTELSDPGPFLFRNSIDFLDIGWDEDWMSEGGWEIWEAGNLGGSSIYSEIVAFEVLAACEGVSLLETEGTIEYQTEGKKTDLLVGWTTGEKVGVSVTRAYGYPPEDPYTVEQATDLLEDKLSDILESSENVAPEDAWVKQVLAVIAYGDEHADSIEEAWADLSDEVRADTVVVVTVTDGEDDFAY